MKTDRPVKKLLAKAAALCEKGRYAPAMAIAKKVLILETDNDEALFYVAHGLYYARQFRRSLQYWKRLRKICPAELRVHLNMGACYDDLGESVLAIKNYKRELELDPFCGTALYNLGALYYRTHKYELATGYLQRCYSHKQSVEAVVGKLAKCYYKTNRAKDEKILYEDYLRTHPNDTWALNNLGSHLMDQGQYHRALLLLRKASQINPADKLFAKNIRTTERMRKKLQAALPTLGTQ
jgi:tetratricopeptide (TPR) repeat protein